MSQMGCNYESIGNYAFQGCTGLTSVILFSTVTSIGINAYEGCSNLAKMTMWGTTPPELLSGAFDNISSEAQIIVPGAAYNTYKTATGWSPYISIMVASNAILVYTKIGSTSYSVKGDYQNSGSIVIPSTHNSLPVTTIEDSAFSNRDLTSITIPNSVTTIGKSAFSYSALTSITIPDSITTLSEDIFSYCSDLSSVTLPNGLTSIGKNAFDECNALTSIIIPVSVTTIGDYAFEDTKLTSITMNCSTPPTKGYDILPSTGLTIHVPDSASVTAYTNAHWNYYGTIVTP